MAVFLPQKETVKLLLQDGCENRPVRMVAGDFLCLRCHGGGGGGQANQTSSTAQTTATAETTASGSATSSGASSPVNLGAQQVNAGGNVELNTNTDPAAFATIEQVVNEALATSGQTQQAIQADQSQNNDALNSILGKVLSQDQSTAANTASGGQTNTNSTVLWIVGIIAAAFAFLGFGFLSRKKTS